MLPLNQVETDGTFSSNYMRESFVVKYEKKNGHEYIRMCDASLHI